MPPLVRISDIGLYLRCPRLVYFDALGSSPWSAVPSNMILRELALSISYLEPGAGLEDHLISELRRAEEELPMIYRDMVDLSDLKAAAIDIERTVPLMAAGLCTKLDQIIPSEVEVDLRSDRLGLSGRLDRLITRDPPEPSIIRMGTPPENGIWKDDRIRLAGYALLLEDAYDQRVDRGFVEYPRAGEIRSAKIRSTDRRRILKIRDRIRQIKEGRLPDRPKNAPCDRCPLAEKCDSRRSLASKFF